MKQSYWAVGAMWGEHDMLPIFVRRGYWQLGYSDDDDPTQAARRDSMQPGDRIAIKRMLGQGAAEIAILAIGVVQEIDPDDKRVYVRWVVTDLDRRAPAKGCFQSIHDATDFGPEWIGQVFHI